ncbi:hypothetical protein L7F22_037381 [Adiantum nelumboides]|nr:hypothetical protein [Adiantum nelumboides]
MEPECDKLMAESINKNFVDMDQYPVTAELQERCVNMIARLFNAPLSDSDDAIGVSTIGSSEAMMLALLACKKNWQNRRRAQGKSTDKPNFVTGSNVQVCWEKFSRYFEVEMKTVNIREDYFVMDPHRAVEIVDENTICVGVMFGSTFNGEYEDVKLLNDLLEKKNKETGWNIPIHVDAASGGFVAPFLDPDLQWDFRLPLVRSINVSGHKYGLVYPGIGWVIWCTRKDLPEELIFHMNYLGGDLPTFTLNFSKSASNVIAQYYQLIRFGIKGYKAVMSNCRANALHLEKKLEETGRFKILSKQTGVPVVAFALKDKANYDEYAISKNLRQTGWILPAYTMPPDAQRVTLLRAVIREDFSSTLGERLVQNLLSTLEDLDKHPPQLLERISQSGKCDLLDQLEVSNKPDSQKNVQAERGKTVGVC